MPCRCWATQTCLRETKVMAAHPSCGRENNEPLYFPPLPMSRMAPNGVRQMGGDRAGVRLRQLVCMWVHVSRRTCVCVFVFEFLMDEGGLVRIHFQHSTSPRLLSAGLAELCPAQGRSDSIVDRTDLFFAGKREQNQASFRVFSSARNSQLWFLIVWFHFVCAHINTCCKHNIYSHAKKIHSCLCKNFSLYGALAIQYHTPSSLKSIYVLSIGIFSHPSMHKGKSFLGPSCVDRDLPSDLWGRYIHYKKSLLSVFTFVPCIIIIRLIGKTAWTFWMLHAEWVPFRWKHELRSACVWTLFSVVAIFGGGETSQLEFVNCV